MGMAQVRVARLTETDWRAFAGMRLRALTDSLGAQNEHYERERAFTAAQWRRRLRAHAQFAVVIDDRPVGLIGAQRQSAESIYLYSLWLDPAARGRGLAHTLVAAAVDWARSQQVLRVTLRVKADNAAARAVYDGLGFTVNGVETDAAPEVTMTLNVT